MKRQSLAVEKVSVPPQRRVEHELQQLLLHVEQHESHDLEKRRRIQQLLDDVRSSDPKGMKADSGEGSRAILGLERGLIESKRELNSGRWTYRVLARRKYSSIDSIIDVPCSFCDIEARCAQEGAENPAKCQRINQWILASVSGPPSGR